MRDGGQVDGEGSAQRDVDVSHRIGLGKRASRVVTQNLLLSHCSLGRLGGLGGTESSNQLIEFLLLVLSRPTPAALVHRRTLERHLRLVLWLHRSKHRV